MKLKGFRFIVGDAEFGNGKVRVAEITFYVDDQKFNERLVLDGPAPHESAVDYLMARATSQFKAALKKAEEAT